MPDHLQCPYCLDAPIEADLPGHLQAHRAADAGGMLLAIKAIVAYQEMAVALLRELRRQREISQALAEMLGIVPLRPEQAKDRAERWQRAAYHFLKSRK